MRIALVVVAVLLSSCSKTTAVDAGVSAAAAPDAAGLAASPDTKGVEGHGGIAVEAPRADQPTDLDGVGEVDANRMLMEDEPDEEFGRDAGYDRSRAKEAYLDGYTIKETQPDDACAKFKEALKLSPPGDETREKAQRQIEKYCH